MEDTRMLPSIGMRCNVRRELELVVIMMLVLTVQRLSDQVDKHTITRKLLQGSAHFTQNQAVGIQYFRCICIGAPPPDGCI